LLSSTRRYSVLAVAIVEVGLVLLHRLEQYFTSGQTRAHFLRQANGRPQRTQTFVGRSAFFLIPRHGNRGITGASAARDWRVKPPEARRDGAARFAR
jgi:hypothetical protein